MLVQTAGMVLVSVQFPGPRLSPRIKMCGISLRWCCLLRAEYAQLWKLKHRHVDVVCVLLPSQTCNHSSSEVTLALVWIWWEYDSCCPHLPLSSPLCISDCLFSAYFSSWFCSSGLHSCLLNLSLARFLLLPTNIPINYTAFFFIGVFPNSHLKVTHSWHTDCQTDGLPFSTLR